jgi:hypothetical protein
VCCIERIADLQCQPQRYVCRERSFESVVVDEFHQQVVRADI